MTYAEFILWSQYRAKYGPLNPVRMYDRGFAIVASQVNRSVGGKAVPNDFISYGKDVEPDIEVDEEGFIAAIGSRAKVGRRRGR